MGYSLEQFADGCHRILADDPSPEGRKKVCALVQDVLFRALAERTIAAAALDVWYRYPTTAGPAPPARRPFHELPNVLMTPHVSGWTEGMLEARARLIADNVQRVARGEPPVNLIPRPE